MKIALAQTNIIWEDKEANKLTASKMIADAAAQGCDIIIFPEVALTGFTMNIDIMSEPAENSSTVSFFSGKAAENHIFITFGVALTHADGKVRNHALTVDSSGLVVSDYAKIHPFSHGVEAKYFVGGDSVQWFDINGITVSPFVCYDLRFPEIFQAASIKSRLLIEIACWPDVRTRHFDLLLKARALENQAFIAAVNRVGDEMKFGYVGHSQIVSPLGVVLTEITEEESLIIADIDISEADKYRSEFQFKKDRRPEIYKKYL